PAETRNAWRTAGQRSLPQRAAWDKRLQALAADRRAEFTRRIRGDLPTDKLVAAVSAFKQKIVAAPKEIATRAASELALEVLTPVLPEMIGGSSDLPRSHNTRPKGIAPFSAAHPSGPLTHSALPAARTAAP